MKNTWEKSEGICNWEGFSSEQAYNNFLGFATRSERIERRATRKENRVIKRDARRDARLQRILAKKGLLGDEQVQTLLDDQTLTDEQLMLKLSTSVPDLSQLMAQEDSSSNTGLIIGGVVGVMALVGLIVVLTR